MSRKNRETRRCAILLCAPLLASPLDAASVRVTFLDVARDVAVDGEAGSSDPYMRRVERYWGQGGLGDSTIIETGEKNILIDGGLWTKGRAVILPYLRKRGIKELDTVILTHQHGDHYGGLTEILREMPVKEVITNGLTHTAKAYQKFMEEVKNSGARYRVVRGGELLDWGGGVRAKVVQVGGRKIPENDYNSNSVVVRMTCGTVHFLFAGDMEDDEEAELLASRQEIGSQILKVGHHGSSTSSTYEFVRGVHPSVAVISIGKSNRFGLPHRSVMDRFETLGCRVCRTDLDGTIVVASDGKEWTVETELRRPVPGTSGKPPGDDFYALESEAEKLWRRKEYSAAAEKFQKALALEPGAAAARSKLGHCYKKLGKKAEAIAAFRKAIEQEPCEPYANLHLGLMYLEDDRQRALGYLESYLKCHPTSKWSHLAEEKIGDIHAARGEEFLKQGKEKEALDAYEKAIAICRDLPAPHFQLGLLYASRDKERAKKEFVKYLDLDSRGPHAEEAREKLRDISGAAAPTAAVTP
ncbi:MAG: tetratricopeptide repeat protein [Candidatus Aureabacteria bacterium]|nr:tetratricopeptide repeat protein [Candidatus Auribacterota bacterium]